MNKRKVCVVLTTRGNYAKLKSMLELISQDDELELQIVLGGMVVLEKYGRISELIEKYQTGTVRNVNFVIEGETLLTMAKSSGLAMIEYSSTFSELQPDLVIVTGDRFECLPIAMAASYMNITVCHIEGGEVSGSIDESIRHAITKMSHIHLPASAEARERIVKLGEDPEKVFQVGATSMDVIRKTDLGSLEPVRAYQKAFGMGADIELEPGKYLVVIQHPVTSEYESNFDNIKATVEALETIGMPTVWIMPNMDAGSDGINKAIRHFREEKNPDYIHFFKSLPIELFAPLLKNSACLVGNSSSGVRESAYIGAPSVNIGTRQNGRQRGKNIIDVDYDSNAIIQAIHQQVKHGHYPSDPLYGDGYAADKIIKILKTCDLSTQKTIAY